MKKYRVLHDKTHQDSQMKGGICKRLVKLTHCRHNGRNF